MVSIALPSGSGMPANSNIRPVASVNRLLFWSRSRVAARMMSRKTDICAGRRSAGARVLHQIVHARVIGQTCFIDFPHSGETPVPQIEPSVRRKYREGFEQIVECRRAHAQQCVARTRQLHLFGTILENQQQSAIRRWLCDGTQMRAIRQQPVFFARLRLGKPAALFAAPFGKVAYFGDASRPRACGRARGRIRARPSPIAAAAKICAGTAGCKTPATCRHRTAPPPPTWCRACRAAHGGTAGNRP